MKENLHAAPQKTEKQIIMHRHWCDCRSKSTGLPGGTRKLLTTRRMKGRNARQPCRGKRGGYSKTSEFRSQWLYPLGYKDWTPNVRRLDPGRTRPQDPAFRTRTKGFARPRTLQNSGLHGIQDFAEPRTSWDSRLRRT